MKNEDLNQLSAMEKATIFVAVGRYKSDLEKEAKNWPKNAFVTVELLIQTCDDVLGKFTAPTLKKLKANK
jgi:hypothetical protein